MIKTILNIALVLSLTLSAYAADHDHDDDTPLAKEMSAMAKPYKSLSRAFKKAPDPAKNAEYVAWAEAILKHAKLSAQYTPALAEKLDPAAKKKMEAAYQAAIKENVQTLQKLVTALKAQDYTVTKQLLADIKSQKSKGHDKFQEDED